MSEPAIPDNLVNFQRSPKLSVASQGVPLSNDVSRAKTGGGSGGGDGMSDFGAKDYVDARLEASGAKIESQISAVLAEIKIIRETVSTRSTVWGAALTIIVSVVGIVAAFLAFGGDRFDGGVQLTASSVEYAIGAKQQAEQNAIQMKLLFDAFERRDAQIDQLIKALEAKPTVAPSN